jgi:putative peptidoglycan lipid II flippase
VSLVRPSLLVGLSLVASRLLGFARDVLIAGLLGAGPVADAFLVALRLPQLVRRILGEGALNTAVVPLFRRLEREADSKAASRLAADALAALAVGLLALLAALEILAPLVTLFLAPAYVGDAALWDLSTFYLRLMLPFVALVTMASAVAALLNAQTRFLAAALAPVAVNVLVIAATLAIERLAVDRGATGTWLGVAISTAGLFQLLVVAAALRGAHLPWRRPRFSPDIRRLFSFGGPALVAGGAVQLILLVASVVASARPAAVSWLYYADRLFQLPLSMVGTGLGIVLLPTMAAGVTAPRDVLNRALEAALALTLPAAAGLAILAQPIVGVLFERGAFAAIDTRGTAAVLIGLSAGLPAAVVGKVLAQDFFARERMQVPILALAVALAVTLAGSAGLAHLFGVSGLGAGASLGFLAHALVLSVALAADGRWSPDRGLIDRIARCAVATFAMALVVVLLAGALAVTADGRHAAARLIALCLAGVATYTTVLVAIRGTSFSEIRTALFGR